MLAEPRDKDLRDAPEHKRERDMRYELRQQQLHKQAELRSKHKQHISRDYEGGGSSSQPIVREGKRGYYVRKPRPGYDEHHSSRSPRHVIIVSTGWQRGILTGRLG